MKLSSNVLEELKYVIKLQFKLIKNKYCETFRAAV
jgi:hypothetical protein